MTIALLVSVLGFDALLVAALVYVHKKQRQSDATIREMTDERTVLEDLRSSVREELQEALDKIRGASDKVHHLGTEVEAEIAQSRQTMENVMNAVLGEAEARIDEPLQKIEEKQAYIEQLMQRLDKRQKTLSLTTRRGEQILKVLSGKLSYAQIQEELQEQKMMEVRSLLARGEKVEAIAHDLGLAEAEVNAIAMMR